MLAERDPPGGFTTVDELLGGTDEFYGMGQERVLYCNDLEVDSFRFERLAGQLCGHDGIFCGEAVGSVRQDLMLLATSSSCKKGTCFGGPIAAHGYRGRSVPCRRPGARPRVRQGRALHLCPRWTGNYMPMTRQSVSDQRSCSVLILIHPELPSRDRCHRPQKSTRCKWLGGTTSE